MSVGIERLQVYVPQYALRLTELAAARDIPPEKLTAGLGVQEMAIAPPCEDVVTLAATAGARPPRAARGRPAGGGRPPAAPPARGGPPQPGAPPPPAPPPPRRRRPARAPPHPRPAR